MRVILISVAGIRPHLDEVRVEPYVFPATMTFPGAGGEDTEHTFQSPEELEQFLTDVGLQGYVTDVGGMGEEAEPQYRYFMYNYDEDVIEGLMGQAETFGSAAEAAECIEPQMTNVMIKRFEL